MLEMEDAFGAHNLHCCANNYSTAPERSLNLSSAQSNGSSGGSAEQPVTYSRPVRILSMALILAAGLLGNCLVLLKMCRRGGRAKRRKIDFLITQLALADLYVTGVSLLSQLVWELLEDEWLGGDLSCRLFMVLQVSGLLASSNMIAVIALERHQVVMNPLGSPLPARALVVGGWLLALLLSVPQAFVFRLRGRRCISTLSKLPSWHSKAYILYSACTVFLAPFCILCVAYSRILCAMWRKERGTGQEDPVRLAAVNSAIPRATVKTLKMTLVIIVLFFVCGLPYFLVELKVAFGTRTRLDMQAMAVLGIFVVTNSAMNPYVYLCFSSGGQRMRRLEQRLCLPCCLGDSGPELPIHHCNHRRQQGEPLFLQTASSLSCRSRKEPTTTTSELDLGRPQLFMGRSVSFRKQPGAASSVPGDCSL